VLRLWSKLLTFTVIELEPQNKNKAPSLNDKNILEVPKLNKKFVEIFLGSIWTVERIKRRVRIGEQVQTTFGNSATIFFRALNVIALSTRGGITST